MARLAFASEPFIFNSFLIITILCAQITSVIAGPTGIRSTSKCVSFCKDTSKFAYEVGTTYVYEYATDISTSLTDGSSKESRIFLKALAEITPISSCEFQLLLKNVRLEESDLANGSERTVLQGAQSIINDIQSKTIRFAFQDGKIEQLCSSMEEAPWVLNIKRGLLSIMQNTMDNLENEQVAQEVDVSGQCSTKYQPSGSSWGGSQTFQKVKDLGKCSQRQSHITALQSIPYASNSPLNGISLLTGTQECVQTIRNKKIENVSCRETHKFQPFEQSGNGAQTIVIQTLMYSKEYASVYIPSDETYDRKSTLLNEIDVPFDGKDTDISTVQSILTSLEAENEAEIKSNAANKFIDLVESMRMVNFDGLKALFETSNSELGKKYLLDSLPIVGTASSLKFLTTLLIEGKLTAIQEDAWLTSLAFIKNPRIQMISALLPLLNNEPRKQAMLGISSLIHTYCKENGVCTEDAVQQAITNIFTHLGDSCKSNDYEQKNSRLILIALKAIGNAGRVPKESEEESLNNLQRCFLEKQNPIEIRLGAIDSFRRMGCKTFDYTPMLNRYTDMSEDTEVRIRSYLSVMRCPDRHIIDSVKDILYTDAVNQVGSFVWTHLTNLQETSSPDKQAIRNLIANDFLKSKFNTDSRKFSRNYEGVAFWEDLNAGANFDANVIFTPDSFIPRSAMLNLTALVFGQAINIAEFEARVHSLEQLLEPIFGPQGYFPDTSMVEVLHSLRRKRDVSNNEIERLGSVYEQATKGMGRSPGGSFHTRIFGHEILYKNFEFSDKGSVPTLYDEGGKNWFDISRFLNNLSTGKKTEFTKSNLMMDIRYTVATSAGIPLTLGVQSATTVKMAATGRFDVARFLEKKELEIQGSLQPSASIKVDGVLKVQLGQAGQQIQSGMRLENTLHSSTSVKGHVIMKGTKVIHASLSLPQDKQEIFEISSQIFLITPSGGPDVVETGPAGVPKIQHQMCTSSRFSYLFGVKLCGEIDLAEHFTFPPNTPARAAFYLEKTDTFTSYEFDYKFDNTPSATEVTVVFNTPGSLIDRKFSTYFNLDSNHGKMVAGFQTPVKTFKAEGLYSKAQKSLQLTLNTAQDQIFLFSTNLRTNGRRIEPTLLLTSYNRPLAEFIGMINLPDPRDETFKSNFDFALKHLTQKPISLKGDISKTGEKYDTNFEIDSYMLSGQARSQFRLKPGHFSTKTSMHYSWENSESKNVEINAKLQNTKKGALTRYNAAVGFFSPQYPEMNLEFNFDTQISKGYCENTAKFTLGKFTWDAHTLYKYQVTKEQQDLDLQLSLTVPKHGVDWNFELMNHAGKNNFTAKISGRTNSENEIKARFEYQTEAETLLKKRITAETSWPGVDYILRAGLIEKTAGEFEADLIILPNKDPEMKATITYMNRSNNMKLDHSIEFRARGFTDSPFFGQAALSASDKQCHIGATFEVEGKRPKGGRWSTSLDYNIVKINTHKIEGKLTLDDKKYNGEINMRQTKSGEKIITVELQLEKHMTAEVKFNIMMQPYTASLSLTPDVDENSDYKLVIYGTATDETIYINSDYFGEPFTATGTYKENSLLVEANWSQDQRFKLSVSVPTFTLEQAIFSAEIETPFTEFQDVSLTLRHHFNGNEMDSRIQGRVEQRYATFSLSTIVNVPESRFSTSAEITGYPKLEGIITLGTTGTQKSFELIAKRGDQERKVNIEYIRLQGGYDTRFRFSGCTVLPKISVEFHHQMTEQLSTGLQIEWIPVRSQRRHIELKLTSQMSPMVFTILLSTPWKNFERWEASVALKNRQLLRELEINLDGSLEIFPTVITAKSNGDLSNFQNEFKLTWNSLQNKTQLRISSVGHVISNENIEIHNSLEFPGHDYKMNIESKKTGITNVANIDVTANGAQIVGGLTWHYINEGKSIEATAWGQTPSVQRSSIEFKHERNPNKFIFVSNLIHNSESLFELSTHFEETRVRKYELQAKLQSTFSGIPTVKIESQHDMQILDSINHFTDISIKPMPEYVWGVQNEDEGLAVNVRFDIKDRRDIIGNGAWGSETIEVTGEFTNSDEHKKLKINVTPSVSKPVEIDYNFEKKPHHVVTSFAVSSGGKLVVNLKLDGKKVNSKLSGDLDMYFSFGPHLVGTAVFDSSNKLIEMILQKNKVNVISFHTSAMVTLVEGEVRFEVESPLHPLLKRIKLSYSHSLTPGKFLMDAKYENADKHYSVKGVGVWSEEAKTIKWALGGEWDGSLDIEILGADKLNAMVVYQRKELAKVNARYSIVQSDYALGKHTIDMVVSLPQKTYPFNFTVGVDMNRAMIDVRTPFEGWSSVIVKGGVNIDDIPKKFSFSVKKEKDVYTLSFQLEADTTDGNIWIGVDTPYSGFKNISGKLVYTIGSNSDIVLEFYRESQNVLLNANWSPSNVLLKIQTSMKNAKTISFGGNWELYSPNKKLDLVATLNDETYKFNSQWEVSPLKSDLQLNMKLYTTYEFKCSYDFTNDYNVLVNWKTSGRRKNIGGNFSISNGSILLDVTNSISGYESIKSEASYWISEHGHHHGSVFWDVNGKREDFDWILVAEKGKFEIHANTPWHPWNTFNGTLKYDFGPKKSLSFSAERNDGKKIEFDVSAHVEGKLFQLKGQASAVFNMKLNTPMKDFSQFQLTTQYNRHRAVHSFNIFSAKTTNNLTGNLVFSYENTNGFSANIKGDLVAPYFNLNRSIVLNVNTKPKTLLNMQVNLEGVQHSIDGSFEFSKTVGSVEIKTSLQRLKIFKIFAQHEPGKNVRAIVEINDKKTVLKVDYQFDGLQQTKASLELTSPINGFKSVAADAHFSLQTGKIDSFINFQNDWIRCMSKLNGSFSSEQGNFRLQINSPIYNYEQMLLSTVYTIDSSSKSLNIEFERNTMQELTLDFTCGNKQVQVAVVSKHIRYPVDSKITVNWSRNPLHINVHVDSGAEEYKGSLRTNFKGFKFGEIQIESPFSGWEDIKIGWHLEGNLHRGKVKMSYDITKFGAYVGTVSWTNENWKRFTATALSKSGPEGKDRGLELKYDWSSREKLSISMACINGQEKREIHASMVVKTHGHSKILQLSIKTPFSTFQELAVHAKLNTESETTMEVKIGFNRENIFTVNSKWTMSPLMSFIDIDLNSPKLCKPFKTSAVYDLITSDKKFNVFFTQEKYILNVTTTAVIPTDSNEIQLNMNVDSNVPIVPISASGFMKANYKTHEDDTREITVSLDTTHIGKWKVVGAIRPSTNFYAKFEMESPDRDIVPSIRSEINWRGNTLQGISSDVSIQIKMTPEVKATFSLGADQFRVTFNSGLKHFEAISAFGRLETQDPSNRNFELQISLGEKNLSLNATLQTPSESSLMSRIQLVSAWKEISGANFEVRVEENGNVNVVGQWGDKSVAIRGNIRGNDDQSLWKAAASNFSFEVNSVEKFRIQSNHLFGNGEYSFNASIGPDCSIQSYVNLNTYVVVSTTIQYSPNVIIKFNRDAGPGRFSASFSSPWTKYFSSHGLYRARRGDISARLIYTYDEYQSVLEASSKKTGDFYEGRINIDLPVLQQKADCVLIIRKGEDNLTESKFEIKTLERHLLLQSSWNSFEFDIDDYGKGVQRDVEMVFSLPGSSYPEIRTRTSIKQSVGSCASFSVDMSFSTNSKVSNFQVGYNLPVNNFKKIGLRVYADSELLSDKPIEFVISAAKTDLLNFSTRLQYHDNDVSISWNFATLPEFTLKTLVSLPDILQDSNPYKLEISGSMDLKKKLEFNANISCNHCVNVIQTSMTLDDTLIKAKIFIDSPRFLGDSVEFNSELQMNQNGRYVVDISGVKGIHALYLSGQSDILPDDFSVLAKATGTFGAHFVQFQVTRNEEGVYNADVSAESMTLLKGKLKFIGLLKPVENGFDSSFECRTGKSTFNGVLSVKVDAAIGHITAKFASPEFLPVGLDANWEVGKSSVGGKLGFYLNDVNHQIEMFVDNENYEARLNILCPYIPNKEFNIHLKFLIPKNNFDVLGDFKINKSHWRLEGTTRFDNLRDMETKLEIRTTFEFLDRLTFAIKSVPDEFHVEIYTPYEHIPNILFTIGGLMAIEEANWTNMQPHVVIGLPSVFYQLSVTSQWPTNITSGEFSVQYEKRLIESETKLNYEISLETSVLKTLDLDTENVLQGKFRLKTPYENFTSVECLLGGKMGWETGIEMQAMRELNGQVLRYDLKLRKESDSLKLSSVLITPFEGYDKYTFSIRLENYEEIGVGHSIQVDFLKPEWKEPVQLEVDYRYRVEGFTSMDGELSVSAPFFGIYPFTIRGKSGLNNRIYNGIIEGQWEGQNPNLKLEAGWAHEKVYVVAEGKAGKNAIYQAMSRVDFSRSHENFTLALETQYKYNPIIIFDLLFSNMDNVVNGQVQIKTKWENLQSADIVLVISPFSYSQQLWSVDKLINLIDVSLGVNLNGRKIMQIELISKNGKRSLEIHNPFRPISITVRFERQSSHKVRVNAVFCWNLNKRKGNTIGVNLLLCRTSTGKDLTVNIHAGKMGSILANVSHLFTSNKLEQSVQLQWNRPTFDQHGELGYKIIFNDSSNARERKFNGVVTIDTPWRSVQVESQVRSTEKESNRLAVVHWDAKRDLDKRIGFQYDQKKSTGWRSFNMSNQLTVAYSGLSHDLVISSETQYKYNELQNCELKLKTSNSVDNDFTFIYRKLNDAEFLEYKVVLKHPSSNFYIGTEINLSPSQQSLLTEYMDVRGFKHVALFSKAINRGGVTLLAEAGLDSNLAQIFHLDIFKNDDQYVLNINGLGMEFDGSLKQNFTWLDMLLKYETGKQLHVSAGMPHKKEISIKVWRDEFGMYINDFVVALRLNTSQLISTTVIWRPELFDQMQDIFVATTEPKTIKEIFGNALNAIYNVVSQELYDRWDSLEPEMKKRIDNIVEVTRYEINIVLKDVYSIWEFVKQVHYNNTFYTQNIAKYFESSFRAVSTICEKLASVSRSFIVSAIKLIKEFCIDVCESVQQYSGEIENIVMTAWDDAEKFVVSVWEENFQAVANFFDYLEELYETIEDIIERRMEALEERILAVTFVRKVMKWYQDYSDWLEELPIQDYIDNLIELFEEKIWRPLERHYKPYFDAINQAFDGDAIPLLDIPPMPYLRFIVNKLSDVTSHLLKVVEAEQKIKHLVRQSLKSFDGIIHRNIPSAIFVWDTDSGRIEYQQSLVFISWEDFTQVPQWTRTQQDEDDLSKMSDFYYEIIDNFRNARPILDMNMRDILPPFGAHAVMAGDYHYFTFDKKYFRFAGECSYVLAADLLHQNFSLIVNYEQKDGDIRKKSYSLLSANRVVEIDTSNFKVTLDGRKTELPLEVGPTFIRRQPSGLEVFDSRGFQMSCSLSPSVCTVSVSGWYFGKLAGLLGSYDNEQSNDFKTPDGQLISDVSTFAHSWRVGKNSGNCRAKNWKLARDNVEMTDVDGICNRLLSDISSPLRPCFNKVDTAIYTEMCKYDTSINVNSAMRQEAACTAISAYVSECQKNNIDVWMPPSCVLCKLEDGTALISGENATLMINTPIDPPKSSDVILIIQEASCLNNVSISEAMTKLDLALRAENLTENRYAIVGFGGKGVHRKPHIRTSSSQVWAHSTLFKIPENIQMDGEENGDLYEAIEYAAALGFRAGVSKTIIALTCGDERCGASEQYADMLTLLVENDIKFHILAPKEITMKGNNKKQVDLYGMDINGVYTSHPAKRGNVEADIALKRQINLPKDLCTPLAMETNGTRFSVIQSTNKKFLDIWSRRIAQTSQPSECQRCECIPDKNGRANLMCHQCVSPNLRRFMDDWASFQYLDMDELAKSEAMEQEMNSY